MEKLKEFKYYDPKTKEPIANPDRKLTIDKNNVPSWNGSKGKSTNPGWWVAAETKGEQDKLKNFKPGKGLDADHVLTSGQAGKLDSDARRKAAAAQKAADKQAQEDAKQAQKAASEANAKTEEEKLQAAIAAQKAAQAAKKAANDQIAAENRATVEQKLAPVVASLTEPETLQKAVFNLTFNNRDYRFPLMNTDAVKIRKAIIKAVEGGVKVGLFNSEKVKVSEGEPVVAAEATQKSSPESLANSYVTQMLPKTTEGYVFTGTDGATIAITEGEKNILVELVAKQIAPLADQIDQMLTEGTQSIAYTCKVDNDDTEGVAASDPSIASESSISESKDSCVVKRLLEEDSSEGATADEATPASTVEPEETSSTEDTATVEEAPVEESEETVEEKTTQESVLDTAKLGKIVDLLNKGAKDFKSNGLVYDLEYKLEDIDAKNGTFKIIATRKDVKAGENVASKFMKGLEQAGLDFLDKLASGRGVMDI